MTAPAIDATTPRAAAVPQAAAPQAVAATPPPKPARDVRLVALRRFAGAITLLNVLGHTWFGFEQSWAQPLAAVLAGYLAELLLEGLDARARGARPRFAGSASALFHFLLPAHITGLACSMLLYPNERIAPVVFAVVVGIAFKYLFRPPVGRGRRHFFNPSNTGIVATLLCFHWVGIAPPYMFTENLFGWADWALPAVIIASGSFLNLKLTRKIPLILAWLGGFAAQAVVRAAVFDTPPVAGLLPMTGVAFLLFTFYMVTDPATTPTAPRRQVAFGLGVAAAYAGLMMAHVVFGLFFALAIVCTVRGLFLYALAWWRARAPAVAAAPAAAAAQEGALAGAARSRLEPSG